HDHPVAGPDPLEAWEDAGLEDEPGLRGALPTLLRRRGRVAERRLDVPDRDDLVAAHGRVRRAGDRARGSRPSAARRARTPRPGPARSARSPWPPARRR